MNISVNVDRAIFVLGSMMFTLSLLMFDVFWLWDWTQYLAIIFVLTIIFAIVCAILSYIFESKKKQILITHYLSALDNQRILLETKKAMIILGGDYAPKRLVHATD